MARVEEIRVFLKEAGKLLLKEVEKLLTIHAGTHGVGHVKWVYEKAWECLEPVEEAYVPAILACVLHDVDDSKNTGGDSKNQTNAKMILGSEEVRSFDLNEGHFIKIGDIKNEILHCITFFGTRGKGCTRIQIKWYEHVGVICDRVLCTAGLAGLRRCMAYSKEAIPPRPHLDRISWGIARTLFKDRDAFNMQCKELYIGYRMGKNPPSSSTLAHFLEKLYPMAVDGITEAEMTGCKKLIAVMKEPAFGAEGMLEFLEILEKKYHDGTDDEFVAAFDEIVGLHPGIFNGVY